MKEDRSTMAHPFIIRKLANRRGFSISHRAFRSDGEIKRGLWWFGDEGFKLFSPAQGLTNQEAVERLVPRITGSIRVQFGSMTGVC